MKKYIARRQEVNEVLDIYMKRLETRGIPVRIRQEYLAYIHEFMCFFDKRSMKKNVINRIRIACVCSFVLTLIVVGFLLWKHLK